MCSVRTERKASLVVLHLVESCLQWEKDAKEIARSKLVIVVAELLNFALNDLDPNYLFMVTECLF